MCIHSISPTNRARRDRDQSAPIPPIDRFTSIYIERAHALLVPDAAHRLGQQARDR